MGTRNIKLFDFLITCMNPIDIDADPREIMKNAKQMNKIKKLLASKKIII